MTLLTLVDDRFGNLFAECEGFGMATIARAGCVDDV